MQVEDELGERLDGQVGRLGATVVEGEGELGERPPTGAVAALAVRADAQVLPAQRREVREALLVLELLLVDLKDIWASVATLS